jgi:hypothetical protein
MLQISQYDFSDNPNLPRIIDTAKRDFGIDLELDFTIEQIASCIYLIGNVTIMDTIPVDKNGFPMVRDEKVYNACLHYTMYKVEMRKFFMGNGDVNRLQFITALKDRYVNQARVNMDKESMRKAVNIWSSVNANITK